MAGAVTTSLNLFQSIVYVQFQIYTNVYTYIESPHKYLVQPDAIIDFKVLFSPLFYSVFGLSYISEYWSIQQVLSNISFSQYQRETTS